MYDKSRIEEKINALAVEWCENKETASKSKKDTLCLELWNLTLTWKGYNLSSNNTLSEKQNVFMEIFWEALKKYDATKQSFCNYLNFLLSKRNKDFDRKEQKRQARETSLEKPIGQDDDLTLGDVIEDKSKLSPEKRMIEQEEMREKMAELAAMVLNFSERHHKKQATESKRKWYRLCYTEDVTIVLKDRLAPVTLFHERDAWTAMNHSYLDYYMAEPCNSLRAVVHTKFKPYASLVPDDPQPKESLYRTTEGGENVFWAKIPLSYLKTLPESEGGGTFAESTRSTQRSSYKQELHKWTQKYK